MLANLAQRVFRVYKGIEGSSLRLQRIDEMPSRFDNCRDDHLHPNKHIARLRLSRQHASRQYIAYPMPRQQVYGKRSRVDHDAFAIFASPQGDSLGPDPALDARPSSGGDFHQTAAEQRQQAQSEKRLEHGALRRRNPARAVLGERNANSAVPASHFAIIQIKSLRRQHEEVVEEADSIQKTRIDRLAAALPGTGDSRGQERSQGITLVPDIGHVIPSQILVELGQPEEASTPPCSTAPGFLGRRSSGDQPHLNHKAPVRKLPSPYARSLPLQRQPSDRLTQHCAQLLDLSSHPLTSFHDWSIQLSTHFTLIKIAEASFGEVYRLSLRQPDPDFASNDESVFKVIAIRPPSSTLAKGSAKQRTAATKRAEAMSKPDDIANEVKLLQRMSSIPGFTNFRDIRVVQGRPPKEFVQAFKSYNDRQKAEKKELSVFPDPGKKTSYNDDQLWAVIEMQDAGTDLEQCVESGAMTSIWSVWDVFWQVVISLAKGEEGAEFEHRDLHLGNICVQNAAVTPTVNVRKKLKFTSLDTTIIDYTISRCLSEASTSSNGGFEVAFHDLSTDSALFEGSSSEEYQYDIYRYMRGAFLLSQPMADFSLVPTRDLAGAALAGGMSWRQFNPVTNLVWLHFVLYKLLEQVHWPSTSKAPAKRLKAQHAMWKRANDLEHKLLGVQILLDPEDGLCKNELRSASDLIGLALSEAWLDESDVAGVDDDGSEANELVEQLSNLAVEESLEDKAIAERKSKQGTVIEDRNESCTRCV